MKQNIVFYVEVAPRVAQDKNFVESIEKYIDALHGIFKNHGFECGASAKITTSEDGFANVESEYEVDESVDMVEQEMLDAITQLAFQDISLMVEVAHVIAGFDINRIE